MQMIFFFSVLCRQGNEDLPDIHCKKLRSALDVCLQQEWHLSFLSTSSATQAGALDLLISARMICFIMLQSLRSTAPQDAACSPMQSSIFRMPVLYLSKSDIITATDARQSNSSRRF